VKEVAQFGLVKNWEEVVERLLGKALKRIFVNRRENFISFTVIFPKSANFVSKNSMTLQSTTLGMNREIIWTGF